MLDDGAVALLLLLQIVEGGADHRGLLGGVVLQPPVLGQLRLVEVQLLLALLLRELLAERLLLRFRFSERRE